MTVHDHRPVDDHGPSRVVLQGFGFRHLIRQQYAITGVDLAVEPGERVLLLGASGAGKSTLLHVIAGLLNTDNGDVEGTALVDGQPPTPAAGGHGLSRTGIVFQDPDSQLVMSRCGDEVAFGLENAGVPSSQIWPRVQQALAAVGFRYGLERPTQALSGGERQRLVLAGVLALRPRLLLLDEPTANLDPEGSLQVMEAIGRTVSDRSATVIMIEHKITRALPLVDRVVVLGRTGVIADGTPDRVLTEHHDQLAASGVWVDDQLPWARTPRPEQGEGRGLEPGLLRLAAPRRRHTPDTPLLPEPIDLTVRAGEITAITGANGVGKSTLATMAAGLAAPHTGAIEPQPELITGMRSRTAARPIHRWPSEALAARIGTVFQNPEHQFLTSRVRDEIGLGPRHSRRAYAARADALLERLGLSGLAAANPFTLSGGEKRRLSVATALAGRPQVVILDEPTFGQDRRTWIELAQLFAELADDGTALIFVTHDQLLTAAIADHVLELHRSKDFSPPQVVV